MRLFGWFRRQALTIEPAIKPPRVLFVGHDEQMAEQTQKRRELAERIRREARAIETRDGARAKLRSVK